MQDYMEGKSYYLVSEHTLTLDDLPTVAVCFKVNYTTKIRLQNYPKLIYEKDFSVDVKIVENGNKTGKMIATKEGERTSKGASDLVGDSLRGS